MRATELSPTIGVEVHDLDLSAERTADEERELLALFLSRHLILVRGQDVSDDDHVRFVGLFGQLRRPNRDGTRHAYISNVRSDGLAGAKRLLFHSDASFYDEPVWGLSLCALDVSPKSPPTVFVSGRAALERLPEPIRERLDGLGAVFVQDLTAGDDGERTRYSEIPLDAAPGQFAVASHPAVLCDHPELGPILYVNELQTSHFEGLAPDDSERLLQETLGHLYRPEFFYTHEWQPRDLIVWSNLALQHARPAHPPTPEPRTLRRVVLVGPSGPQAPTMRRWDPGVDQT
jgi:taurine dioxygenase